MKILKSALCLTLAISMMTVFASCGTKDNNNNTDNTQTNAGKLTVWGMEEEKTMLGEMFDDFKAAFTDITSDIEHVVTGTDDVVEKAIGDMDNAADVFAVSHDDFEKLVSKGAISEITGEYKSQIEKTCTDESIRAATYDGKLYGFPSSAETYVLFYDKSKLTDTDVKSLTTILKKDVGNGVSKFGMDFDDEYYVSSIFLTAGCTLFGENGSDKTACDFNSDNGVSAAKFIKSLKSQGVVSCDDDEAVAQMKAGKLASYITESDDADKMKNALGDNYGVAKLPTVNINGKETQMKSFSEYKIYVVKAKSSDVANAMKLAQHLTSEQNQIKRFKNSGLIPTNKTAMANKDITSDKTVSATIEQLNNSIPTPSISQYEKYEDIIEDFAYNCFNGNIADNDIKTKLDEMVKKITE